MNRFDLIPLIRTVLFACCLSLASDQLIAGPPDASTNRHVERHPTRLPDGVIATFGASYFRAAGQINAIGLSPSGDVLATQNMGGLIRLWDTATGELLNEFASLYDPYRKTPPQGCVWSKDGARLAALDAAGRPFLMDGHTCRTLMWKPRDDTSERGNVVLFSPDAKQLLVGYDGKVRVYASRTGDVQRTLEFGNERPAILIFREANKHLDVFTRGRKQIRWNWKTGEKVGAGNAAYLTYFQPFGFNHDGIKFHASSSSVTIYRKAEDGGRIQFLAGKGIEGMAASGDTKTIVTGHRSGIVQIWNVANQKLLAEFNASANTKGELSADNHISHVACSHDGSIVATGVQQGTNRVRVWKVQRHMGQFARAIEVLPDDGHQAGVYRLQFTADGKQLLSSSNDKTARIWDVQTQQELARFADAYYASSSSDGKRIALAPLNSGPTRLLDISDLKKPRALHPMATEKPVALTRDGRKLAVMQRAGGPTPIVVLDVSTGKTIKQLPTPASSAYTIKWSEDGRFLAMGGGSAVHVWDFETGESRLESKTASPHTLAFSPNGDYLITGATTFPRNRPTIQVWSISTGKMQREFGKARPLAFAVLADNTRLLSGSMDGMIRVWDLRSGKLLKTLPGHSAQVRAISVAPDMMKFASSTSGAEIFLWDAACLPILP